LSGDVVVNEGAPVEGDNPLRDRSEGGTVQIREMELGDIPDVFELGERLFTADRWPNLYRTWDEYEPLGHYTTDPEFCLVADLDDRIVGFILGSLIDKRKSAWKYGYIVWLGVESAMAGRGIARRLLTQLTTLFTREGVRILMADTQAENLPALRFFRREGFRDPQEHVYLSKYLDPKKHKKRGKGGSKRTRKNKEES
jgi:ribosomal protein S18 acetylase RimI-like enzyme